MTTWRGVAIPALDSAHLYDVTEEGGVFTSIEPVEGARTEATLELWPGYVEAHAHLALPANWDDTVDDPRISALSYLYHGVTHVVDLFGYPLVQKQWEDGAAASDVPYPELVHCGYAATSMRDNEGRHGHGVEFPAPVYMLGTEGDVDVVLEANRKRGATFLKVMFTDGTEAPGSKVRFSRLTTDILADAARVARERGVPAIIDCNTREETMAAYECGFRLFAHSVRDSPLSEEDWRALEGARFVSTIAGLRPMIMEREEFLTEYARPGFVQTQDPDNLDFVSKIEQPFGIEYDCQETRSAALSNIRNNALEALRRGALLVGTDCGNTGAYHGYSLLSELDLLAGDDIELHDTLRVAATVQGRRFFDELAGRSGDQPIAVGAPATFNLLRPAGSGRKLSDLPEATVINGVPVDRAAVEREIKALRSSDTKGKVLL